MTLTPAYGRDYKSKKTVLADWNANKDFIINGIDYNGTFNNDGRYINKESVPSGKFIQIRYKRMTQICVIKT